MTDVKLTREDVVWAYRDEYGPVRDSEDREDQSQLIELSRLREVVREFHSRLHWGDSACAYLDELFGKVMKDEL